jgi:hypothetical protein
LRTARRALEKAISCKSSTKDSAEVGVRIAIGRPSRVTTMAPSAATFDSTAPGLELNSLEAIICIKTTIAQQMPEANQKFSNSFDFSQLFSFAREIRAKRISLGPSSDAQAPLSDLLPAIS